MLKMAQQVEVLAPKDAAASSIPWIHTVEGENQLLPSDLHMYVMICGCPSQHATTHICWGLALML